MTKRQANPAGAVAAPITSVFHFVRHWRGATDQASLNFRPPRPHTIMFGLSKKKESGPFMEHPSGDFDSAVAAMEDAVIRLRKLPKWEQWITFNAQGEGHSPDSYEFAEVRMLGDRLDVGDKPLDIA